MTSLLTTVCLCIAEMNDKDIQTVQKILEGRCLECEEILPDHDIECSMFPVNILTNKLSHVKEFVLKQQWKLNALVEATSNTDKRNKEIMKMIEERLKLVAEINGKDNNV